MLKKSGFIILLCGLLLTGCKMNEEPWRETALPENTQGEGDTQETVTAMEEDTKAPHPVCDEALAKWHNHPEQGRYTMYEYNEEHNAWDFVYVNLGKRLVWEISGREMFAEYEGERFQVPWVTNICRFTDTVSYDLNQDGVDELILLVDQYDECGAVPFVFDVANGQDLSPVYGIFDEDGDIYSGNRIYFNYFPMYGYPAVWSCTAEFVYDESGCRVENIQARTWVDSFWEKIDVVTENSLKAGLEYNDDEGVYYFIFTGENIIVSYSVTVGQQSGDITVEYCGEEYPVEWITAGSMAKKEYFELMDADNDGYDELVWHEISQTGGKEIYERHIYDFQSRSEIVTE